MTTERERERERRDRVKREKRGHPQWSRRLWKRKATTTESSDELSRVRVKCYTRWWWISPKEIESLDRAPMPKWESHKNQQWTDLFPTTRMDVSIASIQTVCVSRLMHSPWLFPFFSRLGVLAFSHAMCNCDATQIETTFWVDRPNSFFLPRRTDDILLIVRKEKVFTNDRVLL